MIERAREAEILAGLRSSSRAVRDAALEQLFRALEEALFALCLRITCQASDAEDALQETFVEIERSIKGFKAKARLSTWVYRIAIRQAVRWKSRSRARPVLTQEDFPSTPDPRDPDPARELGQREDLGRVLRAIASLPLEQRAVLGLAVEDELPHAEIAAILGIPEGTVHSRLHAARTALREKLHRSQVRETP